MASNASFSQRFFSFKSFLLSLVFGALVFSAIVAGIYLNQANTLAALEDRLFSQSVLLQTAEIAPAAEAVPEEVQVPEVPGEEDIIEKDIESVPVEEPREPVPDEEEKASADSPPSSSSLVPAPIEGLHEQGRYGSLPVIREGDNLTAFQAYARPYTNPSVSNISVAILDYGLSDSLSETMLSLPADVTLVLSPYSLDPQGWVDKARAAGHEVWIHLPMQTSEFPAHDPGPRGILTSQFLEANVENMQWVLSRAAGYSGVAVFHDPVFQEYRLMAEEILRKIYRRGLGIADIALNAQPEAASLAKQLQAPHTAVNFTLEDLELQNLLELAEANALNGEKAIFALEPTPNTLSVLQGWTSALPGKGIALVPLSATAAHSGS